MKRLKLNFEILLGIVQEFDCGIDQHEETSEALTKFMLSGREPFHASLNYFSRAHRINFRDRTFDICVKDKTHCFGYDWILKEIILSVSLPSINHFCAYECPENPKGYQIMDQFLKKDLKHLTLFADLPWKYMFFFQYSCNFETVYSQHLFPENALLSKILFIPSEEHRIIFTTFKDFLVSIPYLLLKYNFLLPVDDSLYIVKYPCVKRLILETCDFSPFFNAAAFFDTVTFPNRIYHKAKFIMHPIWTLDNALQEVLHFPGLNLDQIGNDSKYEGNMSFIFTYPDEKLDSVYFLKETNPEIIFDEAESSITRTCKYGAGNFVHLIIKFGVSDLSSNDYSQNMSLDEHSYGSNKYEIFREAFMLVVNIFYSSVLDAFNDYKSIFQSNLIYIRFWPFIIFWYFNWIYIFLFDYSFVEDQYSLPFVWFYLIYAVILFEYLIIRTWDFALNVWYF